MPFPYLIVAALTPMLSACGSGHVARDVDDPSSAPAANTKKAKDGRVKVVVRGFRNHEGQALVSLFSGPKGFPNDGENSLKRIGREIAEDELTFVFDKIPPGSYAVAVLHDEDKDFKMKTGPFGIPKEGYGVSNNGRGRFGPPKYKDAEFKVAKGAGVEILINLIYL